jgi:anti-sigma factor RsiW
LQTESVQRRRDADDTGRLERRRQRGDDAALVGTLLAVLGLMAGAALFAWNVSAGNGQVASATPQEVSSSY